MAGRYGVVIKVATPPSGGNLRTALGGVFLDPQAKGGNYDDPHLPLGEALGQPLLDLYVQVPTFTVGELLAMDDNDRDHLGRKPDKWDVEVRYTDDIDQAVAWARDAADGGTPLVVEP